ncbi:hypothetical protein CAEBREN_30286 [Caenorhabditis brenneri]|uniref:Uncharacterized protein n=1 Tax=Caenorhabditis brenneri TaxID=135651 RepID=G0MHB4_CAEBE|nr:hypothetical protein CAEBREN_30286 [Caenorhabditis brenneri]
MICVLNNLIELAIKQKKENLFFVEAISLAAYDLDREDPIISNQGNLMLQEDERINSLDKELMLNLARRYKGSHRLGIFILIMTETEENDQAGYINLEERTSMLTPVDDRNVNKFVDKYLDGVKYHRLKYTVVALVVWHISSVSAFTPDITNLRARLFKGYNNRVRPVKKESTITKVQVFLNIANVERISCPIVIADWVYGLNQVNLSDPYMIQEYAKPTIRLSFDPMDEDKKLHVGGWEVRNAWKKHCYWGPDGCQEQEPTSNLEYYWSLLEFGVYLKRHLKYYQVTIVAPSILITLLSLCVFWIDACQLSIGVILINLVFQAHYGWYLFQQIPPGSGSTPKIVQLYKMNMLISMLQFIFVTYSNFLEERLPKDFAFNFGFDLTELPKKIGIERLFAPKAISFDPQELLTVEPLDSFWDLGDSSGSTSIGIGNPLNDDGLGSFHGSATSSSKTPSENSVLIDMPSASDSQPVLGESIETLDAPENKSKNTNQPEEERKLRQQFDHIKRFGFLIALVAYITAFLYVYCT